jgi:pyruvate dehydrogenase E2 component (dihydrolipoamide acetyltransferase)
VLVSAGDSVDVDQGLIVLESDKASMEIPSTVAGTVLEVLAKEGDQLEEGAPVAVIDIAGAPAAEDKADDKAEGKAEDKAAAPAQAVSPTPASGGTAVPGESGASGPAQLMDVPVPDIGTDEAVDLVEISVSVGDTVAEGDTLLVLESDKASMEIPSPASGVVKELHVEEGQQVREGDLLLRLEGQSQRAGEAADSPAVPVEAAMPGTAPAGKNVAGPAASDRSGHAPSESDAKAAARSAGEGVSPSGSDSAVYAGPAVRRLARELGVALEKVTSSGPRGRLLKEDVHQYVQRALSAPAGAAAGTGIPPVPEIDFAAFGPVEVVERSKIDKLTAANMQRSWLNVPHVTQFDDADITEMEAFRKSLKAEAEQRGTRLTPLPFLLKACAVALKRHAKINASLSDGGETLTYKRYVHIGMAVDTPAGLVVPVLRDVDKKTLWELAEEVLDLAGRARDRKLKPAEMQGAGFTVSSLGSIGGRGFTPIVNAPEVAILGVSRADTRPVWDGQSFQPRLQLPLTLSYDHRVVNGGDAGRFLTELCHLLGDIRKLLL